MYRSFCNSRVTLLHVDEATQGYYIVGMRFILQMTKSHDKKREKNNVVMICIPHAHLQGNNKKRAKFQNDLDAIVRGVALTNNLPLGTDRWTKSF